MFSTPLDAFKHGMLMEICYRHSSEDPVELITAYLGPRPFANRHDAHGYTPLQRVCMYGHTKSADALIRAGADVTSRSSSGSTTLTLAAGHGHTACAQLLLESGADVHAVDGTGRSALHFACERGCLEMVQMLLLWGADPDSLAVKLRMSPLRQQRASPSVSDGRSQKQEHGGSSAIADLLLRESRWRRKRLLLLLRARKLAGATVGVDEENGGDGTLRRAVIYTISLPEEGHPGLFQHVLSYC
ncbi:unnamed protein product [Chrysoparadoxa australica]